jgi:hypothetical protein
MNMASPTQQTRTRRAIKKASVAHKRKNHDRVHGSTAANLPLNKPNANELAMKKNKAL